MKQLEKNVFKIMIKAGRQIDTPIASLDQTKKAIYTLEKEGDATSQEGGGLREGMKRTEYE